MSWYLYLLECKHGTYYAGITNNLEARYSAHQQGRGARYTRANPPIAMIAFRPYPDRSTASIAEAQLKRMPRQLKVTFFQEHVIDEHAMVDKHEK